MSGRRVSIGSRPRLPAVLSLPLPLSLCLATCNVISRTGLAAADLTGIDRRSGSRDRPCHVDGDDSLVISGFCNFDDRFPPWRRLRLGIGRSYLWIPLRRDCVIPRGMSMNVLDTRGALCRGLGSATFVGLTGAILRATCSNVYHCGTELSGVSARGEFLMDTGFRDAGGKSLIGARVNRGPVVKLAGS